MKAAKVALEIANKTADEEEHEEKSGASVSATAIGIAKNIVGSGIVAMPQVMLYASIIPSLLMTFTMCYLSALSFYMIGKLCHENDCKTFQDLWRKSFANTRMESHDWIVTVFLFGMTFGGLVAYCKLFGDFGAYLMADLNLSETTMILLAHIPLQLLILPESINALRYFNLLGVAALVYFTIYITIVGFRYLGDGVPANVETHRGHIKDHLWVFRWAWLAPFSTLSSAFMAHYNAPRFIGEMKDKNQFKKATNFGFLGALFPTVVVMVFGFLSLRGFMKENFHISGNIIKILGHAHAEGKSAYLMVCASLYLANVLLTYPLVFISLRDTVLKAAFTTYSTTTRLIVSEGLFLTVLGFGLIPIPVDSVIRWKGALFGPFILFILPSMFYFRLSKDESPCFERNIAHFFFYFGGLVCVSSTTYCFLTAINVSLYN